MRNFIFPSGVSISPDDSYSLVSDCFNNAVRKIIVSTAYVSTLVGSINSDASNGYVNGYGTNAKFYFPDGVSITTDGSSAIVSDSESSDA
jgi:hypothetical protein